MSMSIKKPVKKRKIRSLFSKYIITFVSVEFISITIFGGVLAYFLIDSWENNQKTNLYEYAENIASSYEELLKDDGKFTETGFEHLEYSIVGVSSTAKADIFISDLTGKIIYCNHMTAISHSTDNKISCEHDKLKIPGELIAGIIADGMLATRGNIETIYSDDTFIAASVVKKPYSQDAECIVFAIQNTETGLTPYIATFLQIYIAAALVMMFSTGLIIYSFTYNMTKPLRDISEATKQYAKGNFSYRIKHYDRNSVREFDELSAAINAMATDLEQFENSRTSLIANVSHEFKTPMTTISGFIDGILDGTIPPEKQSHYLQIVSNEVKRLSRLVVSMLNMSKIEAGELRINPARFNLTQMLVDIFVSFEQKIKNKDIDVKGFEYLTNCYIEADQDMINQVFYNIIDNAVKFTNIGGEISVYMKSDKNTVSISIRNTGKGIIQEDIGHIFERFYKGDKSRSLDSKSAGLGLFIVKNIVKLHDGDITVKSEDDKYTQFTVKLKKQLIEV